MARDGRIPSIRVGGPARANRPTDIDWSLRGPRPVPGRHGAPGAARLPVADPGELARFLSAFTSPPLERRLAFVARLTTACQDRGWPPPVIVGGHAVEFYSAGGYATVDIDVVSASEPLDEILGSWGFERRGRHWIREDLGLVAEAPSSRLAPGQRDHLTQVQVAGATAYVLGLEDVIVDRLAACVHWSSENDCRWVEVLTTVHKDDLDVDYLRLRATEMEVADRLGPSSGGTSEPWEEGVSRRVDLVDWQHVRDRIRPVQLTILTRDSPPTGPSAQDQAPTGPRTLRSHRPRTDENWWGITEGVRALLAERVASGTWTWKGPRHLVIAGPDARPPHSG